MKSQLSNAAYGVLDYLAYPLGLLAITPLVLKELGSDRFGIWMFAGAAINIGAIAASGFGDANIRVVAMRRATESHERLIRAVRATMGIHLALGLAMAAVAVLAGPFLTAHLVGAQPELRRDCLWSLRFVALMILIRAIEAVCVSTQRAFERYGAAVRVSVAARMASLVIAAILPLASPSVAAVLAAACAIYACGVCLQLVQLRTLLKATSLLPLLDRETTLILMTFGIFAWIQAVSGLVFGQLDRLFTGIAFGAAAVTAYSLCVQLCQPIYGVAAAGLHFLFPRIAAQYAVGDHVGLRRTILLGICANVAMVAVGIGGAMLFGQPLLRVWGGERVAQTSTSFLPVVAWSTAAAGLGVAGAYSMLALGRVKTLTCFIVAGGTLMTAGMWLLAPRYGLAGMAWGRLFYGPVTCLVYFPLAALLMKKPAEQSLPLLPAALCKEAQ